MNKLSILGLGLSLFIAPFAKVGQAQEVPTQQLNFVVSQEEVSPLKVHQGNAKQPNNIKIFFPVGGEARDGFDDVQAVNRWTNSLGVARFAIQELIKGPTVSEQRQGLVDIIELRGESTCGGRDFSISIKQGTATLQFCRSVPTGGVGDDARIQAAINQTLKQFPTINKVVILNEQGDCFKDMSGQNLCFED